jgi:2-succinyl-5-enolpyruvyl-6-hydroxy-3-cyclohexene-1-carboxylate synthase
MNDQVVNSLIQACVDYGVTDICIGAGSRSTALIQALNEQPVTIHPFLDERAVGFLALGITKATTCPVMIVTTSGSAVTNLYPAITEAAHSYHNLIVCTADRPQRLQHTSANQTIQQVGVFNNVLAELQMPESDNNQAEFLDDLKQAFMKQGSLGGPIHINCPLEDPVLHPYQPGDVVEKINIPIQSISHNDDGIPAINEWVSTAANGWLCIGKLEPCVDISDIESFVIKLGWPTIVDGTNHQLKLLSNVAQCADDAVSALNDAEPDRIVYLGGPWISKKMAGAIERFQDRVMHISQS